MNSTPKFICHCKAVTKNEIKSAFRKSGAETLLDIQNLTKASTGCGKCKPEVLSIINSENKRRDELGKQLKLDF